MSVITNLLIGKEFGKSFCSCAPSPPPAPDYAGAAQQQGQANIDAARTQGRLNNPNVFTPYGSQTVTYGGGFDQAGYDKAKSDWESAQQRHIDRYGIPIPTSAYKPGYQPVNKSDFFFGDPDQATIRQTFTPEQQAIFDKGNETKLALSDLALKGAGAAGEVLGQNLDLSGLPARPGSATDTRGKVMDAMMSRVNEDASNRRNQLNSNLLAAGIPTNSKAYQDAMHMEDRKLNDAATQAYLASGQEASRDFAMDSQNRQSALAELLTQRQTPLNEVTALMSGSQVSNPFSAPAFAQNSQVQAAPVFAAQNMLSDYNTDLYNAKSAQAGGLQSGLFQLGSAGVMGAMMSDRRLKSNIVRIGDHPLGIGWYEYDIFGRREQGVMADEVEQVMPDAVVTGDHGYKMVNYNLVGRVS